MKLFRALIVLGLGACSAPDVPVTDEAGRMVGRTEAELVASIGQPYVRLRGENGEVLLRYAYQSSTEIPGFWQVQCFGGACIANSTAPRPATNTCAVQYVVSDGIVRGYTTEGGCK